jgi:hypothetical protein
MISIEIALIAISMAISATNCGFDKAGRPGASVVTVIGIFLGRSAWRLNRKRCVSKRRADADENAGAGSPISGRKRGSERFQDNKPDDPGWLGLALVRKPATNVCLRVLTPFFATIL